MSNNGNEQYRGYFETRFVADERREVLWQTLTRYFFSRFIRPTDCVLELGAGYGHFINNITAARRIAIDLWEGFRKHLAPGVEGYARSVDDLAPVAAQSVDVAFSSNVFEHLERGQMAATLSELKRVLKPAGMLIIVQPNYRFAYREYFDDFTHVAVYSDVSLCDLLEANGFEILECQPQFLPLTVKSRLPVSPLLIRLYLALPWKPMGKQMLVRARPRASA